MPPHFSCGEFSCGECPHPVPQTLCTLTRGGQRESPRKSRRLHFVGKFESCQGVHRGDIRRRCVRGGTSRNGRRWVRSPSCSGSVRPKRCASGCASPMSTPTHGQGHGISTVTSRNTPRSIRRTVAIRVTAPNEQSLRFGRHFCGKAPGFDSLSSTRETPARYGFFALAIRVLLVARYAVGTQQPSISSLDPLVPQQLSSP